MVKLLQYEYIMRSKVFSANAFIQICDIFMSSVLFRRFTCCPPPFLAVGSPAQGGELYETQCVSRRFSSSAEHRRFRDAKTKNILTATEGKITKGKTGRRGRRPLPICENAAHTASSNPCRNTMPFPLYFDAFPYFFCKKCGVIPLQSPC